MRSLAVALLLALSLAPATAVAATPRTSMPQIDQQVMCPTCGVPLVEADSPQANREKAFILTMINEGDTVAQIKAQLVAQYGPGVLALPSDSGFDATVYVVPIVLVIVLTLVLALMLPRWRGRGTEPAFGIAGSSLTSADRERLDAELARFDS